MRNIVIVTFYDMLTGNIMIFRIELIAKIEDKRYEEILPLKRTLLSSTDE